MLLLAPKPMLTAAVAIRPKPSSRRADTPVLRTPAGCMEGKNIAIIKHHTTFTVQQVVEVQPEGCNEKNKKRAEHELTPVGSADTCRKLSCTVLGKTCAAQHMKQGGNIGIRQRSDQTQHLCRIEYLIMTCQLHMPPCCKLADAVPWGRWRPWCQCEYKRRFKCRDA
jgi:hypothetical protein